MLNVRRTYAVLSTASLACLLLAGCGGSTSSGSRRADLDEDDEIGGTGTEASDIRTMCDKFVRSMLETPQITKAQGIPKVALLSVDNRITDVALRFDTDMLLTKMRTQLNQLARGKLSFLDRANLEAVRKEQAAKDEGQVTRSSKRAIAGADFFMTGEARSLVKTSGQGKSTYILYAFRLTDTETSEIVWEESYEQKRVGGKGTIYK